MNIAEILVHWYCHSIQYRTTSRPLPNNETTQHKIHVLCFYAALECLEAMASGLYSELFTLVISLINRQEYSKYVAFLSCFLESIHDVRWKPPLSVRYNRSGKHTDGCLGSESVFLDGAMQQKIFCSLIVSRTNAFVLESFVPSVAEWLCRYLSSPFDRLGISAAHTPSGQCHTPHFTFRAPTSVESFKCYFNCYCYFQLL